MLPSRQTPAQGAAESASGKVLLGQPAASQASASTAIRQGHPEALDPALDFFSPLFDAAKALAAPGLKPPRPKARPLDNVAKCRALLPPELEDSAAYRQMLRPVVSPERKRQAQEVAKMRAGRVRMMQEQAAAKAQQGSTLEGIMDRCKRGPLSWLRQHCQTHTRVRVVTRHGCGVRGCAVGFLVGFDKFMNLILKDVEENYTVMVQVPHHYTVPLHASQGGDKLDQPLALGMAGASETLEVMSVKHKFRWKRRAEQRSRRLHQVLLRGEQVVLISTVAGPQQQRPQ